ncbi:AAA family ATPase [Candidatus Microgenomates bacterium]|nr:MAG: AAA family ATPase [Candidatus Microgenomates bacterium]
MEDRSGLVSGLVEIVRKADIPEDLRESTLLRLTQLTQLVDSPTFLPEIDRIRKYIDWISSLPWNKRTEDILDLGRAREVFESNHHGLEDLKGRIMEYMAVMQLMKQRGGNIARAPILCFVGLVGTGKTTMAVSIAEAMGRKFARIPFGGMGDPLDLRGQSRMHPEAEPGKVIKALRTAQSKNPVILLDEIDRVTDEGRASIMGVLVELLDPGQNKAFVDHYIDYPVDLSEAMFIATANNTTGIATAVMDRLEPITMPSYNDQEKIIIAKKYILPKELETAGMTKETIQIDEDVWINLVRPLGYDGGIRTLQRTMQGLVRKVAKLIIEGKGQTFKITSQNVKEFLPIQ